jgi:hypothetical protein
MAEIVKSGEGYLAKADAEHGLVVGMAIICEKNGQPYFDAQNDHVPIDAMIEAASDFMRNSRTAGEMHRRPDGDVVFAMPITDDIRKFIAESGENGLLIGMAPSPTVLAKFRSGEYRGFSIEGQRGQDEEVQP